MPERLDRFMARANAAYYASHDPFADFTTAPEIAQMFGELIGAWAAVTWQGLGAPDPVLLIEAGPGRGTLMADALRATARVAPGFRAAARVHLIETSARLRGIQASAVPDARWHDRLEDVPDGPAILIANEFLDALPIRQFERREGTWRERYVSDGALALGPVFPVPAEGRDGDVLEVGEAGLDWIRGLGARLAVSAGVALIMDYGRGTPGLGDTLQALRHGQPADPLRDPGEADLTAHVDFPAVAQAARSCGCGAHGPIGQGAFLRALGLDARTARLAEANPARAEALWEAAGRLSAPSRMGSLFKAMAITGPGLTAPPGFEPVGP